MSMRGLVPMFAAAVLMLGSASASAESRRPDYAHSGFYLGINGIYAVNFFDDAGGLVDFDNTAGLNARAGYRFLPWLAAEVLYEWGNNFQATFPRTSLPSVDVTSHTITANLKFLVPVWRAHPYLLIGVGAQDIVAKAEVEGFEASDSQWGFATRPAVGVDFYITEHLIANVEVGAAVGIFNLDQTSIEQGRTSAEVYMSFGGGLQYRF